MPDALGWRKKFGVLAPSTNTIVEPDFYRMGVPGVTCHFSRIHIRDQDLSTDAAFEALMVQIREEIGFAVERVMTAEPDYMVMGMSSETFWGGVEGNRQFQQRIMDLSGLASGDRGGGLRTLSEQLQGQAHRRCHSLPARRRPERPPLLQRVGLRGGGDGGAEAAPLPFPSPMCRKTSCAER